MNGARNNTELIEAVSRLRRDSDFGIFLDWVRSERDARDRENRIPGSENRTSEAQALTTILQVASGEKGDSKR